MQASVSRGPEIFLSLAACVILMLDLVIADAQRHWTGILAIAQFAAPPPCSPASRR